MGRRSKLLVVSCSLLVVSAWASVATAQYLPQSGFIRSVWVTVGAGSVDPAPYWQRKWSATFPHVGGDNQVGRAPELAASIRFELNERKQLDVSVTRWRVALTSEWSAPGLTSHEIDHDFQEVRAFEGNVTKRFGAGRAGYIAGGGAAVVWTRRDVSFVRTVCTNPFDICAPINERRRDTTVAGQGHVGFEIDLTDRIRASVFYRMQVRDLQLFEIGGIYHGVAARIAFRVRH